MVSITSVRAPATVTLALAKAGVSPRKTPANNLYWPAGAFSVKVYSGGRARVLPCPKPETEISDPVGAPETLPLTVKCGGWATL